MDWRKALAYITGTVDEELQLRNEYLSAENRILIEQLQGRVRLTDPQRRTLAEIGHRLGRKALADVANIVRPETILGWYRKLVAKKFDGSKARASLGRPQIGQEIQALILRMARENAGWGYNRIAGALKNLGHTVSDQSIGNILKRHDIPRAPQRKTKTTWTEFIRSHRAVMAATDFFSAEVLTLRGLITYYVLFFIHIDTRRVVIAGITQHPDERWMQQMARNATMQEWGFLQPCRYLIHDRDTKYTRSFQATLEAAGVKPVQLPARSPNLNAYAERWVRSAKEECLSKLILFGEGSLRRALYNYTVHYHEERNHQGKSNVLLFPQKTKPPITADIECQERLGGLLRYYHRRAA